MGIYTALLTSNLLVVVLIASPPLLISPQDAQAEAIGTFLSPFVLSIDARPQSLDVA